jgi:hypothetical protein
MERRPAERSEKIIEAGVDPPVIMATFEIVDWFNDPAVSAAKPGAAFDRIGTDLAKRSIARRCRGSESFSRPTFAADDVRT